MKKIENLEELRKLSSKRALKCFILLNLGLYSSKSIRYSEKKDTWTVLNYIDGTKQVLSTEELGTETNILIALERGALYKE